MDRKKERKREKDVPLFGSLPQIVPWGMVYTMRELGFLRAHGILSDKTALQSMKRCTALQECLKNQGDQITHEPNPRLPNGGNFAECTIFSASLRVWTRGTINPCAGKGLKILQW